MALKSTLGNIIVPSFNTSYEDQYVKLTFHRGSTDDGNLDGKVSGFKIL
jgi:hypothetical protein